MNLLLALLSSVLLWNTSSSLLVEHDDFLSKIETNSFSNTDIEDSSCRKNGQNIGKTVFSNEILTRIRKVTHSHPENSSETSAIVAIKEITETTLRHQDVHKEFGGLVNASPNNNSSAYDENTPVEGNVGMIFLNTNDDAKFIHGNTTVDIVEGKLIKFSGNIEHNTVVNDGVVRIAGPFHLETFQLVLAPCSGSCQSSDDCSQIPSCTCLQSGQCGFETVVSPCGGICFSPDACPPSCPCVSFTCTPLQTGPPPTPQPSTTPSNTPSATPSTTPSKTPSAIPSNTPSATPSNTPSKSPSATPSKAPSKGCFPGDTLVHVLGRNTPIPMKDLNIGDKVWSSGESFTEVVAFGYGSKTEMLSYLKFNMIPIASSSKKGIPDSSFALEISSNHIVFVGEKMEPKLAMYIKEGDILPNNNDNNELFFTKVQSIETVEKEGVYHPFTVEGSIIVNNGLIASTYSIEGVAPTLSVGSYSIMNIHQFQHMLYAPLRQLCAFSPSGYCHSRSSHDNHATHHWDSVVENLLLFLQNDVSSSNNDGVDEKSSFLEMSLLLPFKLFILVLLNVTYAIEMMDGCDGSVMNLILFTTLSFMMVLLYVCSKVVSSLRCGMTIGRPLSMK